MDGESAREAAAWIARLHADDRDERDHRAFRRWLGACERHRLAFERATDAWELVGALAGDRIGPGSHAR